MGLTKEYVITEIRASPEGSPSVLITLRDPSEIRSPQKMSPASSVVTFDSMDDLFRNIGKVVSKQIVGGFATIIELSLDEYEQFDFKVGDRVSIDIDKKPITMP